MSSNELFQVTNEFIKQNSKYKKIKKSRRKGGRYSVNDKAIRQDEVYRLHFEYGYSARRIADLMKVNRNTVNGDIDYWYSKILKHIDLFNPEYEVILKLKQMEIQRTRLRECLDKIKNNSEKIRIERLIYEIDSKEAYTYLKLTKTAFRIQKEIFEKVNKQMEEFGKPDRFLTLLDTISVSKKAHQRIRRIINVDRARRK